MNIKKHLARGFTLVELIIIIVVIAILATIMALNLSKYQADSRDAQRAADVSVISENLERYYSQNGEYPSCRLMTQAVTTISSTTLKGIDEAVFTAPTADAPTNSVQCSDVASTSRADVYPYLGDGSAECSTGSSCLQWKIKYLEESSGTYKEVSSRRSTNINTSGSLTISSTATGFTSASVSWNAVQNSTSYTVQRATNNSFTQNVASVNSLGTSTSISGLSYGTTYYFRVLANSSSGQSAWSNITSETTWSLAKPVISSSSSTSTAITATWGAINHSLIYNVECSTDQINWSACSTTQSGTSHTFTGRAQGTRYYMHVQAASGAYTSAWSDAEQIDTKIDTPAAYTASSSTTYQTLTATSNAICPAGTTARYTWTANGGAWVSGTQYRSVGYTLGWNESVTLNVSTICQTSIVNSGARASSNSPSMSRPGPWASAGLSAYWTASWNGSCPAGTTSQNFYWHTGGNLKAAGNTPSPGSYYNNSVAWGNGGVTTTLTCYGPWGSVQAGGWGPYGSGCVPTITTSICYGG